MSVELLVTTMNGRLPRLLNDEEALRDCRIVIVNQYTTDDQRLADAEVPGNVRVFDYRERGVARNRNRALDHAEGAIAVLCDEDTLMVAGLARRVEQAFANDPRADILTFKIRTPEGLPYKRYPGARLRHNRLTIVGVSEVEIAFRVDSLRRHGLRFDERFGLGAPFPSGEGNILLADALARGLIAGYVPEEIVIHAFESSGKRFEDHALLYSKGALFRRIFGAAGGLVSRAFVLAKYRRYRRFYGLRTAFELVRQGELEWARSQ
ncbi:MAG: glycosyltransferase family 2 protein [Acidobacteriota bacterium]|nr:glycosyltransferase family 2 protein [Acidobacteriota bacterium]